MTPLFSVFKPYTLYYNIESKFFCFSKIVKVIAQILICANGVGGQHDFVE